MPENGNGHKKYAFSDFRLDTAPETLRCGNTAVHLANRPFQVLAFLIENRDRVVSRDELLDMFWDGRDVYDDALRKSIGAIRHALGDTSRRPRFIETRYGNGYRFIGSIDEPPGPANGNSVSDNSPAGAENAKAPENAQTAPKSKSAARVLFAAVAAILPLAALGYYFVVYGSIGPGNPTTETPPEVRSIAVLPLKNLTGNDENEYLSDGITDSIITELSRSGELRVVSRGSTFVFKDKELDPREIGRSLNVSALLEGSIRKKGELLSANLRLISAGDGRVLWASQEFERPPSLAYELQAITAKNVATVLRTEIANVGQRRDTVNADAYVAYLKGRFHWNKRTAAGIRKSIEFYQQAIALDPDYSLAYSGLAESYVQGIWHVPFEERDILEKAEIAGLKAIELDETSSEAHTALAGVHSLKWNWEAAEAELRRAIELDPRNARAYHVRAFHFMLTGRHGDAVESIEKALELDPLNNVVNTDYGILLFIAKRTDDAFQQWRKTVELDSGFALAHRHMANAHIVLGNESSAADELIKAMQLTGETDGQTESVRKLLVNGGIRRLFQHNLSDLISRERRGERVSPVSVAWHSAYLGHKENAIKYLRKAYEERSPDIVLIVDRHFSSSLDSDPRYLEIIKNIGIVRN